MNTIKIDVKKSIKRMILPTLSGMLVTFLFQLVDTYFIGRLGTGALTAVSFTYPLYLGLISLFIGLSSGIGAMVGQAFGEEDVHKTSELTFAGILLASISALIIVGIALVSRFSVYDLLGASRNLHPLIDAYMYIMILGMPLIMVALNMMAALRSTGRVVLPEVLMAISGLINLVLDWVLILGFGPIKPMGVQGAAVATVISWFFVFSSMLILLIKERLIRTSTVKVIVGRAIEIAKIGIPASGIQLINPVAVALMTAVIASESSEAVAAFGIAMKIESLGLAVVTALSVILVPLMAKHFGAKEKDHMDQLVALSGKISVFWSLGLLAVLMVFGKGIAGIFTEDKTLIDLIYRYMIIVGFSYSLYSIGNITLSLLNAVGESLLGLKLILLKQGMLLIPFLFIGRFFGVMGIFISISLTHIIGGILIGNKFNKWLREHASKVADVNLINEYFAWMK